MVKSLVEPATTVDASRPFPLGVSVPRTGSPATDDPRGAFANVAVYAPGVATLDIAYQAPGGSWQLKTLPNVTDGVHHGIVEGLPVGSRYGLRASPEDALPLPVPAMNFDDDGEQPLLLDPYGRGVDERDGFITNVRMAGDFDWGMDSGPRTPWRNTIIYEAHVRGQTMLHPDIPEHLQGTYAGMAHPATVEHLISLGVTAIQLLPVHFHVDELHLQNLGLTNYWGYNTAAFFAPHPGYATQAAQDAGPQAVQDEFKGMVKLLHAAGLEVILDVVYNHTAEGGADGPTLSFRGLDDRGFYHRVDHTPLGDPYDDTYWDVTGCGNTVDASNPFALRLILDSLRYWTKEMRVDGFRFDLMSALTRVGYDVDMRSHLLTAIGQDPTLRHVKLIAEPWDVSMDGYRVGEFPPTWVEWNDQYRDTMRDFWRGRSAGIRTVATRLAGSSDLYADDGRSPYASVNFVTAHDGFTVRDLVSYRTKHNEANGEGNRDGTDNNRSQNFGVEGETDDPEIVALRRRIAANLLVTLCLSNGVPMITAGDERGRTQRGNNNPYCQDNEISWIDWRADDAWLDVYEVTKAALRLRREHPALRQRHWFEGRPTIEGGPKDLVWLHPSGREMAGDDWADNELSVVGMLVTGDPLRSPGPRGEQQWDSSFLIWLNAEAEAVKVTMPEQGWDGAGEVV